MFLMFLAILTFVTIASAQTKDFADRSDRSGAPPGTADTTNPEYGHGITPLSSSQLANEMSAAVRRAQTTSIIKACTIGSPTKHSFAGYMNVGDLKRNIVTCNSPASGGVTLKGGSHVLYVSNPNGDRLNVYSTDGSDCTSSSTRISYYPEWSDNSNSGITFKSFSIGTNALRPAPCKEAQCCTIFRCNNWFQPCSVSVYSVFSGVTAPSPSKLPSPLARASTTSTKSRVASASATPTASATRNTPGAIPASWDPRRDTKYRICYTGPVLNQGSCGSCYANAAAHALAISLCRAAVDNNLLASLGGVMQQVSTQQMLGIYSQIVGTPVTDLCAGGFDDMLLLSYAVNVHPKLGNSYNLHTCTKPNGRIVCTGGCNPYLGISCSAPVGGVVNPSGSATSGSGCSNFYVGLKACVNGGLDAPSSNLTNAVKGWRVVPSVIDPEFAGQFLTTGRGVFTDSDALVAPDYRPVSVPAAGWSTADIASIKKYIMTRGPMTMGVGASPFFMGTWDKKKPYTGTCTATANHAVTLIGWVASVGGVATPSWIIRNSWDNTWGDNGDYYVPIASGSKTSGAGCHTMFSPFGLYFSKLRLRELSDAALHTRSRRYLEALIQNPSSRPVGAVETCINDMQAVLDAGVVAKATMEEKLGATYTGFVVHTLECQVTGNGMIFKAAVSALHPITGLRDRAHITYLKHFSAAGIPDASYDPDSLLLDVSSDGTFSDDAGEGAEGGTGNGKDELERRRRRRRNLEEDVTPPAAASDKPYTVLDQSIVSGTTPEADTSFSAAITNQDALRDPLLEILGLKASAALVISAIIIVGSFLLSSIIYIIYYVKKHSHIMLHLKEHWHQHVHFKDLHLLSHLKEMLHIQANPDEKRITVTPADANPPAASAATAAAVALEPTPPVALAQ